MKTHLLLAATFVLLCSFMTADWVTYQPKDKAFKVQFPTEPQETSMKMDAEEFEIEVIMLVSNAAHSNDNNLVYLLMYMEFPEEVVLDETTINEMLDGSLREAGSVEKNSLISIGKTTYRGRYPGRDGKLSHENGQAISHNKVYVIGQRMYMLQALCLPGKDNNADIERYFNSFDVQEPLDVVRKE